MPPDMSQFVRQEGFDVLWREPRYGGGGNKDSRLKPANDGGRLHKA